MILEISCEKRIVYKYISELEASQKQKQLSWVKNSHDWL